MMIHRSRKRLFAFIASTSILGVVASTFAMPASAYIFLGPDTDTSICANIGSAQHYVRDYPSNWPTYGTYQYEGGLTNWFCRTDTGQRTLPSRVWTNTIPVGTPVVIGKQDIEHYSGSGSFLRDLSRVEWDLDGNGSFEVQDTGPWITAQGTQNEQVDSTVTAWTTRARYFEATHIPPTAGNTTIQMRVTWTDGSTITSSGVFTAVADTVTASMSRTNSPGGASASGPVLTDSDVFLSAASSSSLSGKFSKFEWDLDGNGTYEFDAGNQSTVTTSFSTPGNKSVNVRVTSRGGMTSTASSVIEVRQTPPSGEPGVSINDGDTATNQKAVTLNLAWPEYATEARISNDGGFASSKTRTVPLGATIDWELDDSIKGLFTKVVYVRFNGSGIDNTKTYSDDIILDTTAPTISNATAVATSTRLNFTVNAVDDITGVEQIQFDNGQTSVTKSFSRNVRVPLSQVNMAVSNASVSKSSVKTIRVRVRDGAGNWTKWRTVKLTGRTVKVVSNQTNTKTLTLTGTKKLTARSLAKSAGLKVATSSKISMKVSAASRKNCRVTRGSLQGLRNGTCKISVTVKSVTGKSSTKAFRIRVSR